MMQFHSSGWYWISTGEPEPAASVLDLKVDPALMSPGVKHTTFNVPETPKSHQALSSNEVVCIQWKSINCHLVQLKTILHQTRRKVAYSFTFIWHGGNPMRRLEPSRLQFIWKSLWNLCLFQLWFGGYNRSGMFSHIISDGTFQSEV